MKNAISAKILLLAIAMLCAALCVGCSGGSGGSFSFDEGGIDASGKTLTVQLSGNPTTGYQWTSEVRGNGLTCTSSDYKADATSGNVAGAGGKYVFRFEGTGAGSAEIVCTYARPWEASEADETIRIDVATLATGSISKVEAKKGQEILGTVEIG